MNNKILLHADGILLDKDLKVWVPFYLLICFFIWYMPCTCIWNGLTMYKDFLSFNSINFLRFDVIESSIMISWLHLYKSSGLSLVPNLVEWRVYTMVGWHLVDSFNPREIKIAIHTTVGCPGHQSFHLLPCFSKYSLH